MYIGKLRTLKEILAGRILSNIITVCYIDFGVNILAVGSYSVSWGIFCNVEFEYVYNSVIMSTYGHILAHGISSLCMLI